MAQNSRYYLNKVAAQTPSILLYLDCDMLYTTYIEHSFRTWINKKCLCLCYILMYILNGAGIVQSV
jgi:lipopolysaccharide biosynthesis glycosyltransferase